MLHQLGHAGGAAGEVDQHDVVPAGRGLAGGAGEGVREAVHLLVQVQPALPGPAHDDPVAQGGNLRRGGVHLGDDEIVVHADRGLHLRGVSTVNDVLLRQLQRGGDQDHPQLVQRGGADPVFPAAAQDHHHHVALLQPQAGQEVGDLVGQALDVGEAEVPLLVLLVDPKQRALFGLGLGPGVHHVEAEVEILRHVDGELLPEFLVAVKLDLGQEFIEQVIQCPTPLPILR